MTRDEIEKLDGIELRAAVAREVFGDAIVQSVFHPNQWLYDRNDYYEVVPCYETDAGFMLVVHEMERRGCIWTFRFGGESFPYSAMFNGKETKADTLPVAVCRAAMLCCCEVSE